MPGEPGGSCRVLRFMFLWERFGVYELADEDVERMIEKATEEVETDGWNGGGNYE